MLELDVDFLFPLHLFPVGFMLSIDFQFNLMDDLVPIFKYFLAPLIDDLLLEIAQLTHTDVIVAVVVAQK